MAASNFFTAASAVIPIVLLVLATEERLGFVKPEWRRSGKLHLIAVLLAALIVGEVLALGAIRRDSTSFAVQVYLVVVIACALALVAWGIGWSVWAKYPDEVPAARTWQKKAFYSIGILTVLAITAASI